jgi:hypothetical protein
MRRVNQQTFKAYEKYVLTQDFDEALKELIPGTAAANFFTFLHQLKTQKRNLSSSEKKSLEKYLKGYKSREVKQIGLRYLLFKFDKSENEKEKDDILKEIEKDYLNLTFTDHRPLNLKENKKLDLQNQEDIPHELDENEVFNLDNLLQDLYKDKKSHNQYPWVCSNFLINSDHNLSLIFSFK